MGSVPCDWWETEVGLKSKFCGFLQSFEGQKSTKTYVNVAGEPVRTGIYQCIASSKLCYSMLMFQKKALERGLLKLKKSLDLLSSIYRSFTSAYL